MESARERRDRIRQEQSEQMEMALLAWVDEPDEHNTRRLRDAALTYFGKK